MKVFEKLTGPLTVGALIKAHRTTNALSAEELGKKLKTPPKTLLEIESGKRKLTLKEAITYARKLNEYEDYFALVWFKSEAREAGIDFEELLKHQD